MLSWPPPPDTPFDDLITEGGSPATLYASDGASGAQAISIVVSNVHYVTTIGTERGNAIRGHVPSTVRVTAGQVLNVPALNPAWFVVVKTLLLSRTFLFDPGTTLTCFALPYQLTVTRVRAASVPMQHRTGYGEPRTPAAVSETARTIRAGFSNDNDPWASTDLGAYPKGVTTVYAPAGSDVQLADMVVLPDGRQAVVQQKNLLNADGQSYALQLLLDASGGIGSL